MNDDHTTSNHPMSSGDRLIDQADALIRRHRSFVATAASTTPPPVLPAISSVISPALNIEVEDDIPVLTEVISDTSARASSAEEVIGLALTDQQIATHAAIERWIDESLPEAIMHVLDGFTDRLIAAVSERARAELFASLERHAFGKTEHAGEGDRKPVVDD